MWKFPRPETWQAFEQILADWVGFELNDANADRYGRSGQTQHGIDILARNRRNAQRQDDLELWGIQAKRYEDPPTVVEAQKVLDDSLGHFDGLDVFVLATTSERDTALQDWAINADSKNQAGRRVRVEVWFWDSLCERMIQHPWFREKYLAKFNSKAATLTIPKATLDIDLSIGDDGIDVALRQDGVTLAEAPGRRFKNRLAAVQWELREARRALSEHSPHRDPTSEAAKAAAEVPPLVAELGELLSEALLPDEIAKPLADEIRAAQQAGLSVDLVIETKDEVLHDLPLEALTLRGGECGPLALTSGVSLIRRAGRAIDSPRDLIPGPLRILVVIGSPEEHNARGELLDYERELQTILAIEESLPNRKVFVEILDDGSLESIRTELRRWRYHVIHVSCHATRGLLILEDEKGAEVRVSAEEFLKALREGNQVPPMVVLAGCQTGLPSTEDTERRDDAEGGGPQRILPGLAQALCQGGIPYVVAMQESVSDRYATQLAGSLYRNLADSELALPSTALARARRDLEVARRKLAEGDPGKLVPEWITPSFYMAGAESALLDPIAAFESPPERPKAVFAEGVCVRAVGEFVGRRQELRQLKARLSDPKTPITVLHGVGGIGKSSLAAEVFQRLGHDGRWVASVAGQVTAQQVLTVIADALWRRQFKAEGKESTRLTHLSSALKSEQVPVGQRLGLLFQEVLPNYPLLLLLDNFEDNLEQSDGAWRLPAEATELEALMQHWVAHAGRGHVLITSRYRFGIEGADMSSSWFGLGPLTPDEARKLMTRLTALHDERLDVPLEQRPHGAVIGAIGDERLRTAPRRAAFVGHRRNLVVTSCVFAPLSALASGSPCPQRRKRR